MGAQGGYKTYAFLKSRTFALNWVSGTGDEETRDKVLYIISGMEPI